jgi:hypothetical protein
VYVSSIFAIGVVMGGILPHKHLNWAVDDLSGCVQDGDLVKLHIYDPSQGMAEQLLAQIDDPRHDHWGDLVTIVGSFFFFLLLTVYMRFA